MFSECRVRWCCSADWKGEGWLLPLPFFVDLLCSFPVAASMARPCLKKEARPPIVPANRQASRLSGRSNA